MSTIWLLIIIIGGGFILSKFTRKRVREGLVIDQNGIKLGNFYSGPFEGVADIMSLKNLFSSQRWSEAVHPTGELQIPWGEIQKVTFSSYWRWWMFFQAGNHYWGPIKSIAIVTNSGAYMKQISPPFGSGYINEVIKQISEQGKENLLDSQIYKL